MFSNSGAHRGHGSDDEAVERRAEGGGRVRRYGVRGCRRQGE